MDDKQFIVSWHLTEAGAIMTVARLIAYFWDTSGGAYSPDVQDWEALPADHPLVKGLA